VTVGVGVGVIFSLTVGCVSGVCYRLQSVNIMSGLHCVFSIRLVAGSNIGGPL